MPGSEVVRPELLREALGFAVGLRSRSESQRPGPRAAPREYAAVTGSPVIEPALAVLECELYAQYAGGDHVILVGRVAHIEKDAGRNPLVFFRGRYHTIGGEAPATAEAANAL